jgi:outer membrane protein assembly factor BamB
MKAGFCKAIVPLINLALVVGFYATSVTPCQAKAIYIVTYHYNNARTGANTRETILTPANVNQNHFGKLFSIPVDSGIYAQPLYVPDLTIPGLGTHNVVYVATQDNWLYAFDADNGATLWSKQLGPYQPPRPKCPYPGNTGIIGTPVIQSHTIYVVAATVQNGTDQEVLHALNITTGAELPFGPVIITATVPGTGYGSSNGVITFSGEIEFQRPALLLNNGMLYIGFGAHCDYGANRTKDHGWLFAYDASTLRRVRSFLVTPNGYGGGIWASGGGPAIDATHNIYFSTGDGTYDINRGGVDYGDSVMKLSPDLSVLDHFTPYNQAELAAKGKDLGSGGVTILPRQSTSPPDLLITGGKPGTLYVINRNKLGGHSSTKDNVVQEETVLTGLWSTPTFWHNTLYFVDKRGEGSPKAFAFSGGRISTHPTSQSSTIYPFPGAVPVISANGNTNGILWALQHGGGTLGNEVLHAYDATDLSHELYNSDQAGSRDLAGKAGREFESIIVDNGKVYVPSGQPQLNVYGLLR